MPRVTLPLTFVESRERYSLYRRPDGTEVALAHGNTWTVLLEFSSEVVASLWRDFEGRHYAGSLRTQTSFLSSLRDKLTDPDMVNEVEWCAACSKPGNSEDYTTVQGGRACKSCAEEHYYTCDECEELSYGTTTTMSEREVCENCCDNYYSWCEDCEGYYGNDYDSEHQHNELCCEVREEAILFSIRNDGEEPLANDTRVTVTLPAGVIDDEGMTRIRRHLLDKGLYDISYLLKDVGPEWQTKQGNFAKRLSRLAYNTLKQALQPEDMSQIGVIAREHSTAVDFHIETTRKLNMSAAAFYHEDSCWWQSYSEGRCTLKSNGGFGLRTFSADGDVTGRAWVMPLIGDAGSLTPTFDTQTPKAFVVFNGYGALSGWAPARIMSHMAGWTYRKIGFSCGPMFINSDSGYLIAPEVIASKYNDGNCLSLSAEMHSSLFATEQHNSERVLAHV